MSSETSKSGIFSMLFGRNIPAYTWVGVLYALVVVWVMVFPPAETAPAPAAAPAVEASVEADAPEAAATTVAAPDAEATSSKGAVAQNVERTLVATLFVLPLMSSDGLPITLSIILTVLCLVAGWIEVIRATSVQSRGGNDVMSLVVTIVALVLFVGAPSFGTSAFLIVVVTGIGDLLLDRIVGQAVARRDFGGMIPGGS